MGLSSKAYQSSPKTDPCATERLAVLLMMPVTVTEESSITWSWLLGLGFTRGAFLYICSMITAKLDFLFDLPLCKNLSILPHKESPKSFKINYNTVFQSYSSTTPKTTPGFLLFPGTHHTSMNACLNNPSTRSSHILAQRI